MVSRSDFAVNCATAVSNTSFVSPNTREKNVCSGNPTNLQNELLVVGELLAQLPLQGLGVEIIPSGDKQLREFINR